MGVQAVAPVVAGLEKKALEGESDRKEVLALLENYK